MLLNHIFFLFRTRICSIENQSEVERQKSSVITALQEYNRDGKTIGFVYKLKQSSIWTQYHTDNNQTYSIKNHNDFFKWGEMFTLSVTYVGTRFLSILSLDEISIQSLFGKNIRRYQPFDYSSDLSLSSDDPRPVKEQPIQNIIAHFAPRFIIDSMLDLVTTDDSISFRKSQSHTLTYRDPNTILALSIASHLERIHNMKPKTKDQFGQNTFFQFRHLVEQEMQNEELREFIPISKERPNKEQQDKFEHNFKLALQASQFIMASKYPEQNLPQKYARKK